jgi:hypothetical protein
MGRVEFFRSANVSWQPGVHFKRVVWHSCMQWGWPAIERGERLARWCDYFVFSVSWRTYGVCWHYYPKEIHSRS